MSKLKKFRTCWGQQCADCGAMKTFDSFDRQTGKTTGYRSHCKDCRNIKYKGKYATEEGRRYHQIMSWRSQGIYGMNIDIYESMLKDQNGGCAICNATELDNRRRLCVDHNHDTGQIRALLCDNCNTGLGRFKDDISMLRTALEYLEKYDMKVVV